MAITALSPWGAIFMTPLSANSIVSSPSFLPQMPDKAGLSPFLSSAVAAPPTFGLLPTRPLRCPLSGPPTKKDTTLPEPTPKANYRKHPRHSGFHFRQQHAFQHSFRQGGDLDRDHARSRRLSRRQRSCGLN